MIKRPVPVTSLAILLQNVAVWNIRDHHDNYIFIISGLCGDLWSGRGSVSATSRGGAVGGQLSHPNSITHFTTRYCSCRHCGMFFNIVLKSSGYSETQRRRFYTITLSRLLSRFWLRHIQLLSVGLALWKVSSGSSLEQLNTVANSSERWTPLPPHAQPP